jgi:hypothetical protein
MEWLCQLSFYHYLCEHEIKTWIIYNIKLGTFIEYNI